MLWLTQPPFNVFLNLWHKVLVHQINPKWGILLYIVCWTSRTVSALALYLPRYNAQRHRKGVFNVWGIILSHFEIVPSQMKHETLHCHCNKSQISRIIVSLIKICAIFFQSVTCVLPALYFVAAKKILYLLFLNYWSLKTVSTHILYSCLAEHAHEA